MGAQARVWLALAGLVSGVLCALPPAAGTFLTGAVGCGLAFVRRGPWRAIGLFAVCFALGSVNASLRSVERQAVARLAAQVPACRIAGATLEDVGGLGILASAHVLDCDGFPAVRDAGAVFLDGTETEPGRVFTAEGWIVPFTDEPFDEARRRAGAGAAFDVRAIDVGGPASRLHGLAGEVRDSLSRSARSLGAPGQLLRGLTIGDTSGMDRAS
nr:hypothetical protein [Actinomycetota bacterium]